MNRRPALSLWLVVLLFTAGGASCPNVLHQYVEPIPPVLSQRATLEEVIRVVNDNSAKIRSFETRSGTISIKNFPDLKANVVYEQPRRFRLLAKSLLGEEVDLGSNDELFWLWVGRNKPKELYYCRHDRFDTSPARRVIPVEPNWLVAALGLVTFDPRDEQQGPFPAAGGLLEIRTRHRTPAGDLLKVTLVDDRRGWVMEQRLYDAGGRMLASAKTARHHSVSVDGNPDHRAAMPREVRIEWPPAGLTMTIDLGDVQINPARVSEAVWTRPNYSGWKNVDLSTMRLPPSLERRPPPQRVPPVEYRGGR